jgi:S-disulfanyl-L-cysteine oxidoreductase SoxD
MKRSERSSGKRVKLKGREMKSVKLFASRGSLLAATASFLTTSVALAQQEGGAAAKADGAKASVWSGAYTAAQAKRGAEFYSGACAQCHGPTLNGAGQPDLPPSPAIARAGFLRKWAGKPVAELFVYVRTQMPPDNPGTLSDQQTIDSIAHMFAVSNIPPGDKELPPDATALADLVIQESK